MTGLIGPLELLKSIPKWSWPWPAFGMSPSTFYATPVTSLQPRKVACLYIKALLLTGRYCPSVCLCTCPKQCLSSRPIHPKHLGIPIRLIMQPPMCLEESSYFPDGGSIQFGGLGRIKLKRRIFDWGRGICLPYSQSTREGPLEKLIKLLQSFIPPSWICVWIKFTSRHVS